MICPSFENNSFALIVLICHTQLLLYIFIRNECRKVYRQKYRNKKENTKKTSTHTSTHFDSA